MPIPFRLPDGRVIDLSDDPSQRALDIQRVLRLYPTITPDQISSGLAGFPQETPLSYPRPSGQPVRYPSAPQEVRDEDDDIGILDPRRFAEGARQTIYGMLDLPESVLTAATALATPDADTEIERDLRRARDLYMTAGDDEAAQLYSSQLARGLGQVGALVGVAAIPVVGAPLAVGGAVAMGIAEAARRIADFERATGRDVPWYKETSAHIAGGTIGLSETLLPSRLLRRTLPKRRLTFGEIVGHGLGDATTEAVQEGLAQFAQSATSRGLYDPDALDNLYYSMAQEAKVGGGVGLVASVLGSAIRNRSNPNAAVGLDVEDAAQRARRLDADLKQVSSVLSNNEEVRALKEQFQIGDDTAERLLREMGDPSRGGLAAGFETSLVNRYTTNIPLLRQVVKTLNTASERIYAEYNARIATATQNGAPQEELQALANERDFVRAVARHRSRGVTALLVRLSEDYSPQTREAALSHIDAAEQVDYLSFEEVVNNPVTEETLNRFAHSGSKAALADAQVSLGLTLGGARPLSESNLFSTGAVGAIVAEDNRYSDEGLIAVRSATSEIARLARQPT